jgi:glycosyltransferase involved in cell wall biosynthesis
MRIVELIPSLSVGGAERVVSLLSEAMAETSEVTVVALGSSTGSWLEEHLNAVGVSVCFLNKSPGFDASTILALGRLLRHLRPDVVHTHLHVLKYLLPVWPLIPRCRIVHTLHNVATYEATPADQKLQKLAFAAGVRAVSIGAAVTESFQARYGCPPAAEIANGIPVSDYKLPREAGLSVRESLMIEPDEPVFISVGRLSEQKNHALLLEAFADPRLAQHRAHLLIAGDGELREDLAAQIEQRGLTERVRLLGVRRDVPALLSAADAFVMSSDWEGNPLVVMEAMSAGRAVVATSVGCVPALVSPGSGLLIPPGEVTPLAEALVTLASDRRACQQLGMAASAEATTRFDVSAMAALYVKLFASLKRK